ncbi:hypothetical protein JHK86_022852 [Glycine max]|nr:hypothetical protein JHK86_022852 [Glycine max]
MDAGIFPLRALSVRFRTVRRESLPTSTGISQAGISPTMSFHSATTRVVRVSMSKLRQQLEPVHELKRPSEDLDLRNIELDSSNGL